MLLLIGEWHDAECAHDPDYQACRAALNLVWLGRRSDDEAARLIRCRRRDRAVRALGVQRHRALPYRILKYAKLGRRTIAPDLKGVRTWEHAVTFADGPRGVDRGAARERRTRVRPDLELREWALSQTAHEQNRPLWERLEALGIESGRLGSERVSIVGTRPEARAGRAARSPGSAG